MKLSHINPNCNCTEKCLNCNCEKNDGTEAVGKFEAFDENGQPLEVRECADGDTAPNLENPAKSEFLEGYLDYIKELNTKR